MFDMSVPWWEFVVRGVVVYLFLLFFLRISGRRQIGQYDPFDLILLLIRWPILMAVTVGVYALLYRWGPDRHPRKYRYIWPGAILASMLWIFAGALFSIYVENWGNYEVTFGSVSAAVVLLLWMYNSTQILVLGAAFNAELEKAGGARPKPA